MKDLVLKSQHQQLGFREPGSVQGPSKETGNNTRDRHAVTKGRLSRALMSQKEHAWCFLSREVKRSRGLDFTAGDAHFSSRFHPSLQQMSRSLETRWEKKKILSLRLTLISPQPFSSPSAIFFFSFCFYRRLIFVCSWSVLLAYFVYLLLCLPVRPSIHLSSAYLTVCLSDKGTPSRARFRQFHRQFPRSSPENHRLKYKCFSIEPCLSEWATGKIYG